MDSRGGGRGAEDEGFGVGRDGAVFRGLSVCGDGPSLVCGGVFRRDGGGGSPLHQGLTQAIEGGE